MVVAIRIASLDDRLTQGRRIQRHVSDEGWTATTGGYDQTSQCLDLIDQLVQITCPTMDLSDRPITDGSADGSHVHLQEEVAEGGIRRKRLEMNE